MNFLEAAPPHTSEQLEIETHLALEWLIDRAAAGTRAESEDPLPAAQQVVAIALTSRGEVKGWRTLEQLTSAKRKDAKRAREQLDNLLTGATVVVDARLGGLTDGLLDGQAKTVAVAADSVPWLARADAVDVSVTGFRVRQLRAGDEDGTDLGWSATPGAGWVRRHRFVTEMADGEPAAALVIDGWVGDAVIEDERAEADFPQRLDEHQSWAEECARGIAKRIGLEQESEELLALAARLHDEGKRASRWQRAFKAPVDGRPYAKTRGPIAFDVLDGYRHELGSLSYVEEHNQFKTLSADDKEFVLHLIAAHHGYARPVIGTSGCDDAPPSMVDDRAREVALRFGLLSRRWGPWGLAWWEALLRAADQTASRRNQQRAGSSSGQKEQT
jgi:CRISPR-associated endonuclease/helicase Cas3